MFVCLFGCPIITLNPLTNLPQILIGKLGRSTGMILAWFKNSKMSGLTPGKAGFQGSTGFPKKHGNSVTNWISSLL